MADIVEVAWLAGLLEGEGSFGLKMSGKGVGAVRNVPVVKVAMKDLDVIHRAHSVAGFGRVCTGSAGTKNCVMHTWQSEDRDRVPDLLRALLPFMGQRRAEQIRKVLIEAAPYGWDGTKRSSRRDRVVVIG